MTEDTRDTHNQYDYDAIVRRLGQHVASVPKRYADAWRQVDELRPSAGVACLTGRRGASCRWPELMRS